MKDKLRESIYIYIMPTVTKKKSDIVILKSDQKADKRNKRGFKKRTLLNELQKHSPTSDMESMPEGKFNEGRQLVLHNADN